MINKRSPWLKWEFLLLYRHICVNFNHLLVPFCVYFLAKNWLKTFIKLGNIPTWVMPNLQLRSLPQMLACQYCHVSRLTWDEPGTLSFQSEACFYRPHWRLREQRGASAGPSACEFPHATLLLRQRDVGENNDRGESKQSLELPIKRLWKRL